MNNNLNKKEAYLGVFSDAGYIDVGTKVRDPSAPDRTRAILPPNPRRIHFRRPDKPISPTHPTDPAFPVHDQQEKPLPYPVKETLHPRFHGRQFVANPQKTGSYGAKVRRPAPARQQNSPILRGSRIGTKIALFAPPNPVADRHLIPPPPARSTPRSTSIRPTTGSSRASLTSIASSTPRPSPRSPSGASAPATTANATSSPWTSGRSR